MKKLFMEYDVLRNDAIKLANRMFREGVVPDVIYCPMRGGAYMANVISEFYKLALKKQNRSPVIFAALVARSYTGFKRSEKLAIDGWTYDPGKLKVGEKVMIIDDIYDSGKTLDELTRIFTDEYNIPRKDITVVVHDYKDVKYNKKLSVLPDYWTNKYVIEDEKDDIWIHYLSHELMGLTEEELEEHYYKKDEELKKILGPLLR